MPVDTTKATSLRDKFEKIGEQIREAVVDFSTLEVTTLTGDITQIIKPDPSDNKKNRFDFKNVVTELKNTAGTTKAKIHLVAHTHIDFDHDTVNFVKANITNDERNLFILHQAAIDSAQIARRSFLNFLKEVIR